MRVGAGCGAQVVLEAVFWSAASVLPSAAFSPWPVQVSAAIPLTLTVVRNVTAPGALGPAQISVASLDRSATGDITFTMTGRRRVEAWVACAPKAVCGVA